MVEVTMRCSIVSLLAFGCAPTTDQPHAGSDGSASTQADDAGSEGGSRTSSSTSTGGTAASDSSGTRGVLDESGSTTAAHEPTITATLVTDQNRHYPEMHGGWGPHLRGVMHDEAGMPWFVADAGPSVLDNQAILYFRGDGEQWSQVAAQDHLPGIQQNAASFAHDGTIHTYAIDVIGHRLEHCGLAMDGARPTGCAAIDIGGAYATPANANYVGAALGPDPVHLVWFTVVGDGGGAGAWIYTYDYGGGFNGPIATTLPGFNDLGYVFAAFRGPSEVVLAGQAFTGDYPDGSYDAVIVELVLGQAPSFVALADGEGVDVRSAADVYVDRDSGATHVLAETDLGTLAYFFKPAGASWDEHRTQIASIPGSFRGRFLAAGGQPLAIVRGGASEGGIAVLQAQGPADAAIDWDAARTIAIPDLGPGFATPSALFVPASSYQDAAVGRLEVVACGAYGVSDGSLWHVAIDE